jgi:hypothetical protein
MQIQFSDHTGAQAWTTQPLLSCSIPPRLKTELPGIKSFPSKLFKVNSA